MATSQRAFDQVKSILGKLDRDIDAARARRTQDAIPPSTLPASIAVPAAPVPAAIQMPRTTASPSTTPAATLGGSPTAPSTARPSPFGRATPMRINRPSNMTGT